MSKTEAEVREGYKMTELGPLPQEWQVVPLEDIATVKYGKGKPKSGGSIPVIGSGGTYAHAGTPLIECATLVIGRKGTAGRVWLAEEACWPSDTTFYLEWKRPVDVRFLHGFFVANPLSGEHAKTTLPSLQRPHLERCPVPFPPLAEQQKIAAVLSAVQQAKEKTEAVIEAAKELKKSLMKYLLTYGPVPVDEAENVPLKETEIGEIPEGWQTAAIGEVGEVVTGATPSTDEPAYWGGSVPFITPGNLLGSVIRSTDRRITEEGLAAVRPVPEGAIAVGCIGNIGKVGITNQSVSATNQQINTIIPDETSVDRWFLFHAVTHLAPVLQRRARQTTVPILSKSNFSSTHVPLPSLVEQREIASLLQGVDAKIAAEEDRKQALEELFRTLLNDLMTAKIRVHDLEVET